jgi:hypothetical protein
MTGVRKQNPHGTPERRHQHLRAGEQPCEPCRLALNKQQRDLRADPENRDRANLRRRVAAESARRLIEAHPTDHAIIYEHVANEMGYDTDAD